MGETGRIYRDLWRHPKWKDLSWEARGVWAHFISWSKDNRTKGFVPDAEVTGMTPYAKELVHHKMWDKAEGGYQIHDYIDRNPGDQKLSDPASAQYMVDTKCHKHPQSVRDKLAQEVLKLIEDGQSYQIILAALDRWESKESAPPSWLPLLASDVLRSPEHHLEALLYTVRETGEISRLREYGFNFPSPDIPAGLTGQARREYVDQAKRTWVDGLIAQRKLW